MNPPENIRYYLYLIGLVFFAVMLGIDVAIKIGLVDGEPTGAMGTIIPLLGVASSGLATRNTSAGRGSDG